MKKILLLTLFVIAGVVVNAQYAPQTITITNHTSYYMYVTIYAMSVGTSCTYYQGQPLYPSPDPKNCPSATGMPPGAALTINNYGIPSGIFWSPGLPSGTFSFQYTGFGISYAYNYIGAPGCVSGCNAFSSLSVGDPCTGFPYVSYATGTPPCPYLTHITWTPYPGGANADIY